VPFLYGGALADAVHRLKYEDCPHFAKPLAALVCAELDEELAWASLVAPVALHPSRLKRRGYDQALLLAKALAQQKGKKLSPRAVRRVRPTRSQVGLDRAHRRTNVTGAFEADPTQVAGHRVLLVDDVVTTGATAHAAAEALLAAGATGVRVVALARSAG